MRHQDKQPSLAEPARVELIDSAGNRLGQRAIHRGLRISVGASALGMFWAATAMGIATVMYMECLGASGIMIGLVATVQQLAMVMQLPSAFFAELMKTRKPLWAVTTLTQRMLWFIPAFLPLAFQQTPLAAAWGMLAVITLSSVLMQAGTPIWLSWMADLIPEHIRGRFWGMRQSVTMAGYLAGMMFVGWTLDHFPDPRTAGGSFKGFAIVFSLATLAGVADILIHMLVPEPRTERASLDSGAWKRFMAPLRNHDFRIITIAFSAWTFALGVVGSFSVIYLSRYFHASYRGLAAVTIAASLSTILFSALWGRIMDAIGARAFGALMLTIAPIFGFSWFFVMDTQLPFTLPVIGSFTAAQPIVLIAVVNLLAGAVYAGVSLCQLNLTSALAPKEGRTMAMAVHWTIAGGIGALGPLTGGALMDWLSAGQLRLRLPTGEPMAFYHVLVLIHTAILWFIVLPLLMRVRKRTGDVSVRLLIGNPLRTASVIQTVLAVGGAVTSRQRVKAVRKAGEKRITLAAAELIRNLHDPSAEVREEAALALGRLGTPEAVDALIEYLERPDSDLAPQIARAFREAKHPRSVEPLVRQLESDDRETQAESARTLGEIGDPRAKGPLLELLQTTHDSKVVSASSEALARLGEMAAIHEILPRMKRTRNPVLKRSLAVAVGDLLGRQQSIYPLLAAEQESHGSLVAERLDRLGKAMRKSDKMAVEDSTLLLSQLFSLEEAYEEERYPDALNLLGELATRLTSLIHNLKLPAATPDLQIETLIWHDQVAGIGLWYIEQLRLRLRNEGPDALDETDVLLGIHFLTSLDDSL